MSRLLILVASVFLAGFLIQLPSSSTAMAYSGGEYPAGFHMGHSMGTRGSSTYYGAHIYSPRYDHRYNSGCYDRHYRRRNYHRRGHYYSPRRTGVRISIGHYW